MFINKIFSLGKKPQNKESSLWVFDPVNDNPTYTFSLAWNKKSKCYELTKTQIETINQMIENAGIIGSSITGIMPVGLTDSNLSGWNLEVKDFQKSDYTLLRFTNALTTAQVYNNSNPEIGPSLKYRATGYTFTIYMSQLPIQSDGYPRAIKWKQDSTEPRILLSTGVEVSLGQLGYSAGDIVEMDIRAIGYDGPTDDVLYFY